MTKARSARCPLCEGRALVPSDRRLVYPSGRHRGFALACAFCGLLLVEEGAGQDVRAHLFRQLEGTSFVSDEDVPYGLDIYTLRSAASALGRGIEPLGEDQAKALRSPHSSLAAAARLFDLAVNMPGVSLGILCRPHEVATIVSGLSSHATFAADVVLLVDDAPAEPRPVEVEGFAFGAVCLAARPLGSDFAAQRDALQALARTDWMLQLDADETLAPETGALIGALVAMARSQGARSIGLPRRNLVDGVLSDLFPDTQYRLNERGVRFEGRVHERPDRPWQESFLALHGAILHHLDRAHVETRSRRYEALSPGRGRLEETGLLLEPYRA